MARGEIGDQTPWTAGPESPRSLTAFAQLGLGDGRVNQIGGYLGGGLTFRAPFAGRAQDVLGLAVAAARNGSHYERAQMAAGDPPQARPRRNALVLGLRIAVSP